MTCVLVVEDSPTLAAYLDHMLQNEGFDVRTVTRRFSELLNPAAEAWTEVDVLICDLMMPEVSGLQILDFARQHHPHIRRLAFTAASGPLADEAGRLAEAVLIKPTDLDDILEHLRGGA